MVRSNLRQLAACVSLTALTFALATHSIRAQTANPTADEAVFAEPLSATQPQPTPSSPGGTATFAPAAQDRPATATPQAPGEIRVRGNAPSITLDRVRDPAPARANYALLTDDSSPTQADARRLQEQIRQVSNSLRNLEGEQQKAEVTRILTELLNDYFEVDVKRREAELAQVEERVKNLRDQLNRRREKKQEIIDLQLKVAQNEADGLGFFSGPPASDGVLPGLFGAQANPPAGYRPTENFDPDQPNRRPSDPQPVQPPRADSGRGRGRGGNRPPIDAPQLFPQPTQPPRGSF